MVRRVGGNFVAQTLGNDVRVIERRFGEQHGEMLIFIARNVIRLAQIVRDDARHHHQRHVAGRAAVFGAHSLKLIDTP